MKNKYLKLFLLFISIFCFTLNVKAVTTSGTSENVKIYKDKCSQKSCTNEDNSKTHQKSQAIGFFTAKSSWYKETYHKNPNFLYVSTIGKFIIESSDTGKKDVAYCLQMGKDGPDKSDNNINYKLITTIDVTKCKKIADPDIKYGACGLAEIMYQINETNNYSSLKNNDDASYGVITTVMRMWLTFLKYSKTGLYGNSYKDVGNYYIISNIDRSGWEYFHDDEEKGLYYQIVLRYLNNKTKMLTSKCEYFENRDRKLPEGYQGYKRMDTGENFKCSDFKTATLDSRISAVYNLFSYLVQHRNDKIQDGRFGNTERANVSVNYKGKEQASEEAAKKQIWNVKFTASLGTTVSKYFKANCDPTKEKGCTTLITVKDAYDKTIGYCSGNDIHDGKTCYRITKIDNNKDSSGKDSYVYTFIIHNYKVCELSERTDSYSVTASKPKVEFKYKESNAFARFRIYSRSSGSKAEQLLATYIDGNNFDTKTGTLEGDERTHVYPININDVNCQQSCESGDVCDDLNKKTDIKASSSGTTEIKDECNNSSNSGANSFEERTISDPDMACILNNCDTNETFNYNRGSKLNTNFSNEGICKSYCREEVKFYVPSPVSVNAGMQFTLDLGKTLKMQKAIDDQVAEGKKLTAVVVRFTQCTTVLDGKKYNQKLNAYRDQYYEAKYDYDYPYEYRDHIIPQDEKNLEAAKKSRDSICASASSCKSNPDDEDSVKRCSSLRSSCSSANANVSSLQTKLDNDRNIWANHQNWYNNNPKKIYNLRVNKEYCLLDTNDELKSYISNINDDRVTKSTQTSLRDKVTDYGKETSSGTKMEVTYDEDEKYSEGYNPTIDSVTKQVKLAENVNQSNNKKKESVKWCTDDCYEYEKTTTESTCKTNVRESFKDNSNETRVNDLYKHKYSKYNYLKLKGYVKDIENIYSTMVVKFQTDYFMNKSYSYENFTGIVKDTNSVSGNKNYHKLSDNSYPVSIDRDTESNNNIKYKFSDLYPTKKSSQVTFEKFEYKCYYNVYNTIKKNNCSITNAANKIDITQCSNKCFTMTSNGYSTVDSNCVAWNTNNSKKGLGIVYRNVNLKNMFPVTRENRSNWYNSDLVKVPYLRGTIEKSDNVNVGSLVNVTKESGNNIYNDSHLEVSYKLTTETIKSIKEYNKKEQSNGGYLNETLIDCGDDKVSHPSGATYYKCKGSSFLNMLDDTNGWNAKVGGN